MGGVNASPASNMINWKQHGVRCDGNALILARILSNAGKGYLMTLIIASGDQENRFGSLTGTCVCRMGMKCVYVLGGEMLCRVLSCS